MAGRSESRRASSSTGPPAESSPVYVVYGKEDFVRRHQLGRLIDKLLEPDQRAMCLSEYDGRGAKLVLGDVLDDVRTLPFLGPRRVVVVRNADEFITANREHLEAYVGSPAASGVLILVCDSCASNTKLYKAVNKLGGCVPCEAPPRYNLPGLVSGRCQREYGKRIDVQVARELIEHAGEDLGVLDGELAKLASYVGSRDRITVDDIAAVCVDQRERKVFYILDAMAAGDVARALGMLEEVWQTDREAEYRAIGGFAWAVRRKFGDQGRTRDAMLAALLDADVASKTGAGSVQARLERFILDFSAPAAGRARPGPTRRRTA